MQQHWQPHKALTWMEDLASSRRVVAVFLEVLRQCGEVPCMLPPVRVDVIEASCVWPPRSQEGSTTGPTESLLGGRKGKKR